MLELARAYARSRKTAVIAHAMKPDGSICFVLESGPKLTMTRDELEKAIEQKPAPAVIDTTDGIDTQEASAAGAALRQRRKK